MPPKAQRSRRTSASSLLRQSRRTSASSLLRRSSRTSASTTAAASSSLDNLPPPTYARFEESIIVVSYYGSEQEGETKGARKEEEDKGPGASTEKSVGPPLLYGQHPAYLTPYYHEQEGEVKQAREEEEGLVASIEKAVDPPLLYGQHPVYSTPCYLATTDDADEDKEVFGSEDNDPEFAKLVGDFLAAAHSFKAPSACSHPELSDVNNQATRLAKPALAHYNKNRKVKYELVKGMESCAFMENMEFYFHINFTAKLQQGGPDKLFFAELVRSYRRCRRENAFRRYEVSCCTLEGETFGGYHDKPVPKESARAKRHHYDSDYCFACTEGVRHPKGDAFVAGHNSKRDLYWFD